MIRNKSAYKYKNLFKGPYEIVKTLTNVTVNLQTGAATTIINIFHIKPLSQSEHIVMRSSIGNININIYI